MINSEMQRSATQKQRCKSVRNFRSQGAQRRDDRKRNEQQRRNESPKNIQPYDHVRACIEYYKKMYTDNRQRYDQVLPSTESDCAIGAFDFENYLATSDLQEEAIIKEFALKQPKFKKNEEVCTHWLRGLCQFVDHECPNLHIYEPQLFPLCQFHVRGQGNCTNADCIFRHPGDDRQVLCVDYARGFCKNGLHCDYKHKKLRAEDLQSLRHHVEEAIQSHKQYKYENQKVLRRRTNTGVEWMQ